MKIVNFAESNSVVNKFLSELRDVSIQTDRAKFRYNLRRIGHMMAYEVSKTLAYSVKSVQTPLGIAEASTHDDSIVLGTIFRAGLPFHQGFLDVFDERWEERVAWVCPRHPLFSNYLRIPSLAIRAR